MKRGTALLALPLASLGLVAFQDQAPQFRARADLIQVDVSVVDRARQPVRGLAVADFSLNENGRTQRVETFSEIDLPAGSSASGWATGGDVSTNDLAALRRLVVLVLDDAVVPADPQIAASVKQIGRAAVDRLGPSDQCAVVFTWDSRRSQGFTADKSRLQAAVDRFTPSGQTGSSGIADRAGAIASIDTLRHLADVLASVPDRRKTVLWVSVGSPMSPRELSQPNSVSADVFVRLKEVLRHAERANVNIFAIDPGGLDGMLSVMRRGSRGVTVIDDPNPPESLATDYREFLRTVAEQSGGRAFVNSNEFVGRVDQVFTETGSFYLLGYQSTSPSADGRLRRIEVKVNRPGVEVRARRGYYAAEPVASKVPPPSLAALSDLLPATGLPMRLAAMPFASPSGPVVALAITTDTPATIGEDTLDVVIKAFTPDGIERHSQKLSRALGPQPVARPFDVFASLPLPPGRYEIRIGASARAARKSGGVYADVDIPSFEASPVSLSGVAISVDPSTARPVDAFAPWLSVVPSTRRIFERSERVELLTRAYLGGRAPLTPIAVTATILDAAGGVAFKSSETVAVNPSDTGRVADYRLVLPLATLSSQQYQVTLEAAANGTVARSHARFEVR
jgi:VWFA-related protein